MQIYIALHLNDKLNYMYEHNIAIRIPNPTMYNSNT